MTLSCTIGYLLTPVSLPAYHLQNAVLCIERRLILRLVKVHSVKLYGRPCLTLDAKRMRCLVSGDVWTIIHDLFPLIFVKCARQNCRLGEIMMVEWRFPGRVVICNRFCGSGFISD
jgi:hypothetical protein